MVVNISCEEDKDSGYNNQQLVIPETAAIFNITSSSQDSITTIVVTPSFTDNLDVLGLEVKSVTYSIDNNIVGIQTESPFALNYTTDKLANGTHGLRAEYIVGGERFQDGVGVYNGTFTVTGSKIDTDVKSLFNIDFERFINVGDTVHFQINLNDANNVGYQVDSIKIYWDSRQIAFANNTPQFNYTYAPLAQVGDKFAVKIEIRYSYALSASSYTYSSTVTVLDR